MKIDQRNRKTNLLYTVFSLGVPKCWVLGGPVISISEAFPLETLEYVLCFFPENLPKQKLQSGFYPSAFQQTLSETPFIFETDATFKLF